MKPTTASGTAIEIETTYWCRYRRFQCEFFEPEGRREWCCHEKFGHCHSVKAIAAAEKEAKRDQH